MKNALVIFFLAIAFPLTSQISQSGCYISGALVNQGPNGCGNVGNYCDLASIFVPAFSPTTCGTTTSSGTSTMNLSSTLILPAGCTASLIMEFKPRNYYGAPVVQGTNGCSNSGMDGGDGMSINNSGGTIASQGSTMQTSNTPTCAAYPALGTYTTAVATLTTGCSNSSGTVAMIVTGGTCVLNGISNRGDEIVTFTIDMSGTCGPSCSAVLPVDLLEFYGKQAQGQVALVWRVASEKNVDYYQIERSADGRKWQHVSYTEPYGKGGIISYQVVDAFPLRGLNYYRLSEKDLEGNNTQKKVITVVNDNAQPFHVFQTETELIIQHSGIVDADFCLFDMAGRLVKKIKSGKELTLIDKSEIVKGFYILGAENSGQMPLQKVLVY